MPALSQSVLWTRMQSYYDHMGPEVWEDEVVPLQITSNKHLASIYTNIIIAQINDYMIANNNSNPNPAEPFYIIETGAGHGKFSFYLLKALLKALDNYDLPYSCIRYVMTDITQNNINSWVNHPAFADFIENGILDFALFNAITDESIELQKSKITLGKHKLNKPLFLICNYIFDTLPHDAFRIQDGKLYETELYINEKDAAQQENIKDYFSNASFTFKHHPIATNYYPKIPVLNEILDFYQSHFEKSSFLIPLGGIQCLENLKHFTNSNLVTLVADKAVTHVDLFEEAEDPDISLHGSVSLIVNFDAIARYIDLNNGTPLVMDNISADFQVGCFVMNSSFKIPHTKHAFSASLASFSPHDLFSLCYHDDETRNKFSSLDELLALINLTEWDPNIFFDYYPVLLEYLEHDEEFANSEETGITHEQELIILAGIDKLWDSFFKLEKNQDLPFVLGILLYNLDYPERAVPFYQRSLEQFGEQAETLYNLAITYQLLEENDKAIETAKRTLQVDKTYTPARKLIDELVPVV